MTTELNRRTFLKGMGAAGALGAAAILGSGCSTPSKTASAEPDEVSQPKTPEDTAKKKMDTLTDGKYVTKAIGHEDYLFVETTIKNGSLADIQVINNDETVGIGTLACTMYPARIVESGNLEVDTVTGATVTCMAISSAVKEGIENAGGSLSDFQKGPETPAKGEDQTGDFDVAIMGAGTAGLVAATRLLEKGLSVIVFEKQDIPGGSMSMTYSGVFATESELQTNYGLGRFEGTPAYKLDAMMDALKSMVNPENDRFNGEMPYQRALYANSGKLVDWMHSIGVGFFTFGVKKAYGTEPYLAPGCYEGGCGYAMQFFVDRIGALGGTISYSSTVTEIIQDSEGQATGLKAICKDGSTWTANAKAILLCAGGFAANQEMVKENYPDYGEYKFNCCPASQGEGIALGKQAGAHIECMGRTLGAYLSTTAQAGSRFELAFLHQTSPGIMVNAQGEQFGNIISGNHATMSAALVDESNGGKFYYITDESGAVKTQNSTDWGFDTYKALFNRGDILHFDSIDEVAETYGLPGLAATIEKHNELALAGEADEFKRKDLPYLDMHDGVWVVTCEPTLYLTTGGLAIDTNCHVLREDETSIPRLYAAGDTCGSIEEKDGKKYGMGFDAAMNYGYIAAEVISTELA